MRPEDLERSAGVAVELRAAEKNLCERQAVFLSTRVMMMAARPGRAIEEFHIDEAQPRNADFLGPPFARQARALQRSLLGAMQGDRPEVSN